ncbi:mitochondrial inner membrane protein OXA1L isoform X1 [Schistocerca gregaria]|uniref:mitochondrial inner membrane protein OXA1L isoform X1 n=1 Tax=Schistocerca gregaria TaxID=7010 RepID=UPI00211E80F3|nr:mitochondrial inner membrane protein OXA1L isoform X1 [Schistocerca gregaria]
MAASVFTCNARGSTVTNCVFIAKVLKTDSASCLKLQSVQHVRHYHIQKHNSSRLLAGKAGRCMLQPKWMRSGTLGMAALRLSSTTAETGTSLSETILEKIPEPPVPPPPVLDVASEAAQAVGTEPSFVSLGLGGWSPIGLVQHCLEFLHVDCGLPWWGSIVVGTVVVRVLMFPLVIAAQRNSAKMNNNLPQLQVLQLKMTEARQMGNAMEAARYAQELSAFMKEKEINPFKNMLVPLAQAPLFISFFIGLRRMANVPVESMMTGGLFWFTDLTVPDQYYLLPIITSCTMLLTIEIGADSARLQAANMGMMKYVLRALPICVFPFTINFPGAILCYWVSSNFISLLQVAFLRIPAVRAYFKIEPLITFSPETLPMKPKGFVKGFKESWRNVQITKELEDRQRFDEVQFQKAGRGPIVKTYKHDPTRVIPSVNNKHVAAKKR